MAGFELDHIFVAVSAGAPEAQLFENAGFQQGTSNNHPGQGTANRRIFFENVYLELLYLTDAAVAGTDKISRTGLAERAKPDADTASPFGFCLRSTVDPVPDAPFGTWPYMPPYLPEGMSIPMGTNSHILLEPLLFVSVWGGPSWDKPDHPNGARRVTAVSLVSSSGPQPSEEMSAFCKMGLISLEEGTTSFLKLELDDAVQGRSLDLRPNAPLLVCW